MHRIAHTSVRVLAASVALGLVLVACSSDGDGGPDISGEVKAGGTFRIETDEFTWEVSGNGFDPVAEYVGTNWMIFRNLMLRTLMSYNNVAAERGGNDVHPDLATGPGEVSVDQKTYTYKLKSGIKFSPPVNREVTSKDVAYAFERMATKLLDSGGYQGYYRDLLVGFKEFEDGKAESISGIETPDDKTIVFKLTQPSVDWDYRVAMPAASPVPEEVGRCFKKALEYGQFVVTTGPYMIEGMDKLNIENCDFAKTPPSGFDFDTFLNLVRNPSYDAATDSKDMREALPDRFEFKKNTNPKDIAAKVEADQVDWMLASVPPETLQKYSTTESLKKNLKSGYAELATWYITMNMTEAPFDDVNVRKAASFILDKEGIQRIVGGRLKGAVAEHIVSPDLLGGKLPIGEFDPYGPNHQGDLVKAKEAMKLSKYDTDKDGLCDAKECSGLRHVTRQTDPFPDLATIVNTSFEKIGLKVGTPVEAASYYGEIGVPSKKIHIGSGGGWGPDWPDPLTFMEIPMAGRNIGPAGNINTALLGLTADQAKELKTSYPAGGVPSIDADIDKCAALKPGEERSQCFADLDKKIMNELVPWIPYRWAESTDLISNAVTKYEYDISASEIALAHVAIDPAKQK